MFCDDVSAYLSAWWEYYGGIVPHVSRSLYSGSEGRNTSGSVKNESSITYYTPQCGMRLTSPQQVSFIFRVLFIGGNLGKLLRTLAVQISPFRPRRTQIDHK
jgi:hypothetical protein